MILCPVLGVLYVFLGYIIYRCFSSRVDLEDVIFKRTG